MSNVYYTLNLGQQAIVAKSSGLDMLKFFIFNTQTKQWENNLHWAWRVLYDDFIDYKIISEQEALQLIS